MILNDNLVLILIVVLLIFCIFFYSLFDSQISKEPTIYNRKKFWMKELLILFNDINDEKFLNRLKTNLTVFSEKSAFSEIEINMDKFLKSHETDTNSFICNHLKLILFKGEENLTEKDYAQMYAIILLMYRNK